jgi:hypothetical protein
MAQWEYTHERIERPLGSEGRDVTPAAIREMNRFGADGWEVCSILAEPQAWIVRFDRLFSAEKFDVIKLSRLVNQVATPSGPYTNN